MYADHVWLSNHVSHIYHFSIGKSANAWSSTYPISYSIRQLAETQSCALDYIGKLVRARPCTLDYISLGNWLERGHVLHIISPWAIGWSKTMYPYYISLDNWSEHSRIPRVPCFDWAGVLIKAMQYPTSGHRVVGCKQSPISQLHQRNGQPNSSVQGGVRKTKYRDWAQGWLGRQDPESPRYLITTR